MLGLFVWMAREKKVYFPDVERAEWLNKILAQLWPYVGRYVEDILRTSVEPVVKDSHEMLKSFQFSNIMLGDMPPRVGGIQVYTEHVHRNEIILDMEIIPEIDFNLTNLADVFDFPGLSSLLKGIVADQVANFMVLSE
ncbi:PREDICTED: extended synaptotagmin-3-like [Branchiostoma belcheri]|uniref:Extended synaptotagmin-3-like n=1 Tax=Branchiostoma belcheri TaxID=7741 RepID=A0A6P4ZGH0_BRABE|nr:PREDICTED: extended synaptotagmin-3-like [Branchiostoma belcheri]